MAAQPDSEAQGAGSTDFTGKLELGLGRRQTLTRPPARLGTRTTDYKEWWAIDSDLTADRPPDSEMLKAPGFLQRPT